MKITKKLSFLLLVVLTAFSCDELDELTEFDVTEGFSDTLNIAVPEDAEGMPQTFEQSTIIDLATNQEIQENLNLLQNVSINSLTYEISNFTGAENALVTDASLSFGNTQFSVADINLKQSDDNDVVYTLQDANFLNAIATTLESNTAITATVSGTVNATPVTFDVIINMEVTVTIDVI